MPSRPDRWTNEEANRDNEAYTAAGIAWKNKPKDPTRFPVGKGEVVLLSFENIMSGILEKHKKSSTVIITCLGHTDVKIQHVRAEAKRHGHNEPIQVCVGHFGSDRIKMIEKVAANAAETLDKGGTVFIHCVSSVHRGPIVLAGILVVTMKCTVYDAADWIKQMRPGCEVYEAINGERPTFKSHVEWMLKLQDKYFSPDAKPRYKCRGLEEVKANNVKQAQYREIRENLASGKIIHITQRQEYINDLVSAIQLAKVTKVERFPPNWTSADEEGLPPLETFPTEGDHPERPDPEEHPAPLESAKPSTPSHVRTGISGKHSATQWARTEWEKHSEWPEIGDMPAPRGTERKDLWARIMGEARERADARRNEDKTIGAALEEDTNTEPKDAPKARRSEARQPTKTTRQPSSTK